MSFRRTTRAEKAVITSSMTATMLVSMRIATSMTRDTAHTASISQILNNLANVWHTPWDIQFTTANLLWAFLPTLIIGLLWIKWLSDTRQYRHGEEYGSAHFATPQDMSPYTDRNPRFNLQFTHTEGLSFDNKATGRNTNTLVIGGSGTGKSARYVLPNLRNASINYCVTDPKGELYQSTHTLLEEHGYRVHQLDLIDFNPSHAHFNPLAYIDESKSDISIMSLVNLIMGNTRKKDHSGGDQFWEDSMTSLLTSLIAWTYHNDTNPSMNHVMQHLASMSSREDNENHMSRMDALITAATRQVDNWHAHPEQWKNDTETVEYMRGLEFAIRSYVPYQRAASVTKKSIITSLAVRLNAFNFPAITHILGDDTMNLDELIRGEKTAIFITIADDDSTFNVIAAMFYQSLFSYLMKKCRSLDSGALPIPVHCFLDEFANIGQLPQFDKLIATIRSRNISASIIVQNLAQLKTMYKNEWETIVGNCDNTLFLGSDEPSTTEWVSKRLGKQTIDTMNSSASYGRQSSSSTNYQKLGRELMTADEIAHMPNSDCLYFLRGMHPFYSRKISFTDPIPAPRSSLKHSTQWTAHD